MEVEFIQTFDNLHIIDSWKVSKRDFDTVLDNAKSEYFCTYVDYPEWYTKRKKVSLICEWTLHNFLYNVGLWRSRTKDVDLNYPCDKPEWLYTLLGSIVKPFIN